jgi:hypothetical protein
VHWNSLPRPGCSTGYSGFTIPAVPRTVGSAPGGRGRVRQPSRLDRRAAHPAGRVRRMRALPGAPGPRRPGCYWLRRTIGGFTADVIVGRFIAHVAVLRVEVHARPGYAIRRGSPYPLRCRPGRPVVRLADRSARHSAWPAGWLPSACSPVSPATGKAPSAPCCCRSSRSCCWPPGAACAGSSRTWPTRKSAPPATSSPRHRRPCLARCLGLGCLICVRIYAIRRP